MNTIVACLVTLSLTSLGLLASAPASRAGVSWCGNSPKRNQFDLFDVCASECMNTQCNTVRMACYESCWDRQPTAPDICPEGMEVAFFMPSMCYPVCPGASVSDGGVFCMECPDGGELDPHGMCPVAGSAPYLVSDSYYVWSPSVAPLSWSVASQGVPVACPPDRHLVMGLCYPNE